MAAYWFQGLLSGGLVGLAGGYLSEREGHQDLTDAKWKHVGIWSGTGAAAGMVFGLVLGAADRGTEKHVGQGGYLLISDILGGTLAGGVIGGTAGAFYANATSEPEHAAFGAALGGVIGAGLGVIIGLIEAPSAYDKEKQRRIQPAVVSARDVRNRPLWVMGASGRF